MHKCFRMPPSWAQCPRSQQLWPELRWLDGWHATCRRRRLGRCTGVDEARMCGWKMPYSASSPALISPISKCVTIITELTFFYPTLRGLDLLSGVGSGRRNIGSNTSCMAWQDPVSRTLPFSDSDWGITFNLSTWETNGLQPFDESSTLTGDRTLTMSKGQYFISFHLLIRTRQQKKHYTHNIHTIKVHKNTTQKHKT